MNFIISIRFKIKFERTTKIEFGGVMSGKGRGGAGLLF
jgi:hypothetical protein